MNCHFNSQPQEQADAMNFLNEVAERYPHAISFASGRPAEEYFFLEKWLGSIPNFIKSFEKKRAISPGMGGGKLSQYGRTNGVINDLISLQVKQDEMICCEQDQILVTTGCQEALDLCVAAICKNKNDVILVQSPVYIGMIGAAARHDVTIMSFTPLFAEDYIQEFEATILAARDSGRSPKIFYCVPNFDNPTGVVLPLATREKLASICAREKIVIIEDNPYGLFRYEGDAVPPIFSLAGACSVIYCGTYSKTICPTLRVGYLIVPPDLFGSKTLSIKLLDELSRGKSFVSVNTSQISQAIVGAILLDEEGSLYSIIDASKMLYKKKRDLMLAKLQEVFSKISGVSWNKPEGGFFLTLELPFPFLAADAAECAEEYGVIVMPLSFFSLTQYDNSRVRLAFSYASLDDITAGVGRFGSYVSNKMSRM